MENHGQVMGMDYDSDDPRGRYRASEPIRHLLEKVCKFRRRGFSVEIRNLIFS